MRQEVFSAVDFLTKILRNRCPDHSQAESFGQTLKMIMCSHYQNHWFPEKPFKGSGYRCIRINHKMDPLISKAGKESGLSEEDLFDLLPRELTLWVDPQEVCYRIGEDGSVGVLFGEDCDSSDSLESSSGSSLSSSGSEDGSCSPSVNHNLQQQQQQQQQPQQQYSDFMMMQSCKDQLRCSQGLTDSSADSHAITNFEYLASFVAS